MGYLPQIGVWVGSGSKKTDPSTKPVPLTWVRVLLGRGRGIPEITRGLPMQFTMYIITALSSSPKMWLWCAGKFVYLVGSVNTQKPSDKFELVRTEGLKRMGLSSCPAVVFSFMHSGVRFRLSSGGEIVGSHFGRRQLSGCFAISMHL